MSVFRIDGPFDSRQIRDIYKSLMAADFYDEKYNSANADPGPYNDMADVLESVFQLRRGARIYDLGSGRGYLTLALARKGLEAQGIEFSPRVLDGLPATERPYFMLVNDISEVDLSSVDLIISMEVFEHLPLALTVNNLTHLHKAFSGEIFLTIPSLGYDRTLPDLGHAETDPYRLSSMIKNVVCPYLLIEDGHVSGGHITLAGYRWWEDFFLTQGFVRLTERERRFGAAMQTLLAKGLRWCVYILEAIVEDNIAYGRGWHDPDDGCRWNGPDPEIQFISTHTAFQIRCQLSLPPTNIVTDAKLGYFVEQLFIEGDYQIASKVVAAGRLDLNGPGADREVTISVRRLETSELSSSFPIEDGAVKPFCSYRVQFQTPIWIPTRYVDNGDERQVGFLFRRIDILSEES